MVDNRMQLILNHIQAFKNEGVEIDMKKFNTLCDIVEMAEKVCETYDEIRIDFNENAISCAISRFSFLSFNKGERTIICRMIELSDAIQIDHNKQNNRLNFRFLVENYLVSKSKCFEF